MKIASDYNPQLKQTNKTGEDDEEMKFMFLDRC